MSNRAGQTYCDWCYGDLTEESVTDSIGKGLDRESTWACRSCLAAGATRTAPEGWDGEPAAWPFRTA